MNTRPESMRRPQRVGPSRPGSPGGSASTSGLTAKDVLRILRRRWLMITLFVVVSGVISVGGTLIWRIFLPKYTVESSIALRPPEQSMLRNTPFRNTDLMDRYKETQGANVKNVDVLRNALKTEAVEGTVWYQRLYDSELKNALTYLDENLRVVLPPNTELIQIRLSMYCADTRTREELPTIVNAVTEAFLDRVNRGEESARDREINTLDGTIEVRQAQIDRIDNDIRSRLRTLDVSVMGRQKDELSMAMQEIVKDNNELLATRAELEKALTSLLQQQREQTLSTHPMVMERLEADPILRGMETALNESRAMFEVVQSKYGPEARQYKNLVIRIEGLEREIEARRQEVTDSYIASMLAAYEQELAKTIELLAANADRFDGYSQRRRDLNDALTDVDNMKERRDALQKEIADLNARLMDVQMVRSEDLPANLNARAQVPIRPSGPSLPIWITAGIVLGMGLGVGLALLLELMDTSVKTPTDIVGRAELPLLAMIPHEDDLDEEIEDYRLACRSDEQSMLTESFRELWTNLKFAGPVENRRVTLITSASPDDGRTTVSSNLALTGARSGARILLVDANFRRPTASRLYGLDGQMGLSDVLSGQAAWNDCVRETDVPDLTVLAAGPMPPNPTELIGGDLAKSAFSEMASHFDQVIVDGPPLLLINDARILAALADGVIVVVRAGVNTHGIVGRVRGVLNGMNAHIIGGVLNGIRTTAGGYLRKNYDAFHEYHEVNV
ncbi:MAG: polysaccharide biosynthesis tyrosine autokinase [Planctomycetota bacterium]